MTPALKTGTSYGSSLPVSPGITVFFFFSFENSNGITQPSAPPTSDRPLASAPVATTGNALAWQACRVPAFFRSLESHPCLPKVPASGATWWTTRPCPPSPPCLPRRCTCRSPLLQLALQAPSAPALPLRRPSRLVCSTLRLLRPRRLPL